MSDSITGFTVLLADMRERSINGLILRPSGIRCADGDVLLGVDALLNLHLLVPVPGDHAFEPTTGDSLTLTDWHNNQHPRFGRRHMDLACTDPRLRDVFGALVDNILERIESSPVDAPAAVLAGLEEWRTLLQDARRLGVEAARGLFGELTVLRKLAGINPHYAVERWTGPMGECHDFTTSRGDIEVKTSAADSMQVAITSLDQLDQQGDSPLVLVRVRVHETPQGRSIDDLISELVDLGCPSGLLETKVRLVGHTPGQQPASRFIVSEEPRAWRVDDDFPGLRSSDLPERRRDSLHHVSYSVDLAGAAPNELAPEEFEQFCRAAFTNV